MENKWLDSVILYYKHYYGSQANVVIDVGTRDGDDAEFLREKLNAQRVIAIDANPIAIEKTRKNYPNFEIIETGISDFIGTTTFTQNLSEIPNEAGTSAFGSQGKNRDSKFGKTAEIQVNVTRMDKLLEELGLTDQIIDVIKVDIETYTYQFLVGMGDQLKNVKVLHLETEREKFRPDHRTNTEVAKFMRGCGFVLKDVSYEWGQGIQDQVWVNPNLMPGPYFPSGKGIDERL